MQTDNSDLMINNRKSRFLAIVSLSVVCCAAAWASTKFERGTEIANRTFILCGCAVGLSTKVPMHKVVRFRRDHFDRRTNGLIRPHAFLSAGCDAIKLPAHMQSG